jgi:hypothetical protein
MSRGRNHIEKTVVLFHYVSATLQNCGVLIASATAATDCTDELATHDILPVEVVVVVKTVDNVAFTSAALIHPCHR